LNRYLRDYLILLGLGGVVIALDQWTKWLVRTNIPYQSTWLPNGLTWLSPYARIVNWNNSGAAFGSFQNGNSVFTVLAILVICAIMYYYPRVEESDWTLRLAMGLQLGGAAIAHRPGVGDRGARDGRAQFPVGRTGNGNGPDQRLGHHEMCMLGQLA